jgi:hypothetical protein
VSAAPDRGAEVDLLEARQRAGCGADGGTGERLVDDEPGAGAEPGAGERVSPQAASARAVAAMAMTLGRMGSASCLGPTMACRSG